MLEERIEKLFGGIRLSRSHGVEQPRHRYRFQVQVPIMVRLSREGKVALGDVYTPCVALGGVDLGGRPAALADILVLDGNGQVSAVACRMQDVRTHAEGAHHLERVVRLLGTVKTRRSLDALYRRFMGKCHPEETAASLALAHWDGVSETSVERVAQRWVENMASGTVALYLATERRAPEQQASKTDPISPMRKLLENHAGGILQVEPPVTSTRPQTRFLQALEQPARLIWVYRRMIAT